MGVARKYQILKYIVEYFIKTAQPVGSNTLINEFKVPYSSATIRNDMATLENLGYLEKPHTSAGRIPSDKGYRLYVDNMLAEKEKEVEEIIAKEHERIEPLVAKLRERLQGKRVFICGGTGRSFAAAALINDFGMELVGLETPTYDADAQTDIEYLNGIHKDYVVDIANMQPFEQVNLINRLKPDAFIGVPDWAAKLGIPTTHVLDGKRPTMGYDGLLFLGNKIADQLQNPGFNVKLAKHAKLPYKDTWYNEDAFKYIVK